MHVFKHFSDLLKKHLCLQAATFLKIRLRHDCFVVRFQNISFYFYRIFLITTESDLFQQMVTKSLIFFVSNLADIVFRKFSERYVCEKYKTKPTTHLKEATEIVKTFKRHVGPEQEYMQLRNLKL